jgi:hypothetical protein
MSIISAEDFVDACKQPVAIGTAICMVVMLGVNVLAMYAWFLKLDKIYNTQRLLADQRTRQFIKRITNKQDKHRYIK